MNEDYIMSEELLEIIERWDLEEYTINEN